MCVIAYCKKKVTISDECIKQMFEFNPDGAGVMYKGHNKVNIKKGFFDAQELLDYWHTLPTDSERAIHCRIATSGLIDADNTHPFRFKGGALMHNGLLKEFTPPLNGTYSDTRLFTKKMIAPLAKNLNNPFVQKALERLTQGSRVLIFQESASTILLGDWVTIPEYKGVLFSNQNFMYQYDRFIKYNYILLESKTAVNETELLKWCRRHSLELGNVEPSFNQATGVEIWGYIDRNIDSICGHRVLDVY